MLAPPASAEPGPRGAGRLAKPCGAAALMVMSFRACEEPPGRAARGLLRGGSGQVEAAAFAAARWARFASRSLLRLQFRQYRRPPEIRVLASSYGSLQVPQCILAALIAAGPVERRMLT